MSRTLTRLLAPPLLSVAAAIAMTWPLAAGLDRFGRSSGDGLYSVWNVAWVARTLTSEPSNLFEANIFHPDRLTLAYSEANVVAGVLGIPGWLLTGNAYVAHNSVVLIAFATAVFGAWLLARRLTGDPLASAAAALVYGFCPYLFAHTAHIQLLLCGGIPICFLMLHRLVDGPSIARGLGLGIALAVQALASAYYGILAGLLVAYGVLFFAASRRLWTDPNYWIAAGIAAIVTVALLLPWFSPYLLVQQLGFGRSLDEAARYSANPQSYLASPAHAHGWLLARLLSGQPWSEVLFPGLMGLGFGSAGFVLLLRRPAVSATRAREVAAFYASMCGLAVWASFGPQAGLYSWLFQIPVFSFLRAPARFGIILPLVLSVFAAFAFSYLVRQVPAARRLAACAVLALAVLLELRVAPFRWEAALPRPEPYRLLAKMPRGALATFPFYADRPAYPLHTGYMVYSTIHWQPMLNGYSDYIPARFRRESAILNSFPSDESFDLLCRRRARYISLHWQRYGARQPEIRERLARFRPYLRLLAEDDLVSLFEIGVCP